MIFTNSGGADSVIPFSPKEWYFIENGAVKKYNKNGITTVSTDVVEYTSFYPNRLLNLKKKSFVFIVDIYEDTHTIKCSIVEPSVFASSYYTHTDYGIIIPI